MVLSELPDATIFAYSELGLNTTSLTEPWWPPSLCTSFPSLPWATSQILTNLSAEPAVTIDPSWFQAARRRFFSKLCWIPYKVWTQRSLPWMKGLTSQILTELSIELETRWLPSGLTEIPVTVSKCPSKENSMAFFFKLIALMELSKPPKKIYSPAIAPLENATDVS